MLRLVAYDIASAKRRRRVENICRNYGFRLEFSVFQCNLDQDQFLKMWQELQQAVDRESDRLAAWPICDSCRKKASLIGVPPLREKNTPVIC